MIWPQKAPHTHDNNQHEPLPPYFQRLCPLSQWAGAGCPRIILPPLPHECVLVTSRIACTHRHWFPFCLKERDVVPAFKGRHLTRKHDNQPTIGVSDGDGTGGETVRQASLRELVQQILVREKFKFSPRRFAKEATIEIDS